MLAGCARVVGGAALLVMAGCTGPADELRSRGETSVGPTTKPVESSAPGWPISAPTVAIQPIAGKKVDCRDIPYPGSLQYVYQVHDCWVSQRGDGTSRWFLAGTDDRDRRQGLIIIKTHDEVETLKTPGKWGSPTIFFVRWNFICFTTRQGGPGALDANNATFKGRRETDALCPDPSDLN